MIFNVKNIEIEGEVYQIDKTYFAFNVNILTPENNVKCVMRFMCKKDADNMLIAIKNSDIMEFYK